MISPMTKYSFILLSGQTEEFLSKIQDLGVIDITRSVKPVDEKSEALLSEADTVKKALTVLNSCDAEPEKGFRFDGDPVEAALKAQADVEELKNELSSAKKELSARKPWGQFSTETIGRLEAQGLKIRFYSCQKKRFDPAWAEIQPLQVVSETDTTVFFVTVAPVSEAYSFPIEPMAAPEGSVNEMELTIKNLETKLSERKKLLGNLKGCIGETWSA